MLKKMNERKLKRRDFLKLLLTGAGALAASQIPNALKGAPSSATPRPDATRIEDPSAKDGTAEVIGTFEAHVGATDEAKEQPDLNRDLSEIPPNLFFASVEIAVDLKDSWGYARQGTATIIEEDTKNRIAYGVAAGHSIKDLLPGSENALAVKLLQPHFGDSMLVVDIADIRAIRDSATEVGVFAIRYSGSFPIGSFGSDRLGLPWRPNSNEPLFVLGYPNAAQKNKFLASELRLNKSLYGSFITPEGLYVALSRNAGPGSSGELVVTADGYGVGVVKSIAKINGVDCILITPLTNQYAELKRKLVFP